MSAQVSATPSDFASAFSSLLPRAYRVAFGILGNDTDAEDAAAEALARAHASWKKVGSLPHRDAWVMRVTANVAIDMVRKARALPIRSEHVEFESQTVLRVSLVKAISSLPRRQREVIALRWLQDMSEEDIASALNVSQGTVKKTTHRGMAALRARLGRDWNEPAVAVREINDA